jgi:hypothetical protein
MCRICATLPAAWLSERRLAMSVAKAAAQGVGCTGTGDDDAAAASRYKAAHRASSRPVRRRSVLQRSRLP